MKKIHYIIVVAIIVVSILLLSLIPLLFPKYPEYQDFVKVYEWGEIETKTVSHIIDHKNNYGYVHASVAYFPYSRANENCELELLNFEVKPTSGVRFGGDAWKGSASDYWKKNRQKKQPVLISVSSSRNAQIVDIELLIKLKTGESCQTPNMIINIEEKLLLEMRQHTLRGVFSNLILSV